jgi:DNA-binding GntR family transcriptional regulator
MPILNSDHSRDLSPVSSLPDIVYERLRRGILTGEYPPGHALRQDDLAAKLGTSRVPLREAMRRLESEGLLILRPRRGYAVISLEVDEIREIFELRAEIEAHAGRIAATTRTAQDIARVETALRAMENIPVSTPRQIDKWLDANIVFHERLFASAKRKHLSRITQMLRDLVEPYIRVEVGLTKDVAEAQREHRQMLKALRDGDALHLGELCRQHCEHTATRLIEAL